MLELVQFVVEVVKEVGFPIACVGVMFFQQEQERKAHKEESAAWVEALNRNTNVVEKVLTLLGVD